MKKAHGNMYDWVDWMCDPVKYCSHYCKYCYARRWLKKTPELNYKELHTIKPDKGKIFVGYMGDLFCKDMDYSMLTEIITHCQRTYGNEYVFQTKNPIYMESFTDLFPMQSSFGITLETNEVSLIHRISDAPDPITRVSNFIDFILAAKTDRADEINWRYFITIEPIMDFNPRIFTEMIRAINPDFVNIGADSKGHHLPEPSGVKVRKLISALEMYGIEVKLKSNLKRLGV